MNAVLYIHGKGGNPAESSVYKTLFPGYEMIGLGYRSNTPWDAEIEFRAHMEDLKKRYENIVLVANSIGAYFSVCARLDRYVCKAYFVSPIVDMEKLIENMMAAEGVGEEELRERKVIPTAFGEDLSWEYLRYVRIPPTEWTAPTHILYGSKDQLTDLMAMEGFAEKFHATLSVMDGGEHWFHTEEQMEYLREWILRYEKEEE